MCYLEGSGRWPSCKLKRQSARRKHLIWKKAHLDIAATSTADLDQVSDHEVGGHALSARPEMITLAALQCHPRGRDGRHHNFPPARTLMCCPLF